MWWSVAKLVPFTLLLSAMAAYSIYATVLYTTGKQMAYLPIAHHFAPFLPIFLYARAPDCVWTAGKDQNGVDLAYRLHWTLYLLFQVTVMVLYAIPIYAPSTTISPLETSVFSAELDLFRRVTTGVYLGAVAIVPAIVLRTSLVAHTSVKDRPQLDAHESVAHTVAWIVAWSETVIATFSYPNAVPIWYAIDSPHAVTISGVFCWLYYPRDSTRSNLVSLLLIAWLSLGLSVSITTWVYDIVQVESVATYMNITTYENMFIDNTTVVIRDLYRLSVPISKIPLFSAASMTAQLQGILWTVVGLLVATSALGRLSM